MVKTYLRYEQHSSFGVISSANAIFGSKGKIAITAALEDIYLWNIRQGTKIQTLHHESAKGHVTYLALSPDGVVLAAGYSDGTISLWDYQIAASSTIDVGSDREARAPEGMFRTSLAGHRTDVTALSFSADGALLVSGANDNELIVWDVVAEKGSIRLTGHRNAVTSCVLLDEERKVISASRDGMVKIWDLETQRCVQTLAAHHNPVWALAVSPDHSTLVTGATDRTLRVWRLGDAARDFVMKKAEEPDQNEESSEEEFAKFFGTLTRTAIYKDHVGGLTFNKDGTLLACHGSENTFDIFLVYSKEEVMAQNLVKMEIEDEGEEEEKKNFNFTPADFFVPLESTKTEEKIKSFAFDDLSPSRHFMISNGSNSVHIYKLGVSSQDLLEEQKNSSVPNADSELFSKIDFEGHPTDIRFVALSYDDTQILSVSLNCVKIFSSKTRKCTRTIPVENAICGSFVPGDMHVVLGTKIGKLFVVELASGIATEIEGAHAGALWSVCVFPNGQGLATASSDKTVKFWTFSMQNNQITLSLVKAIDVESEATCVCISPDSKHVAVSLLDYTVKIFNMGTFKFFLSLYGHKLPVLSISISSDSALIATASADKNLKIWGMDFGDCHKSIFAHNGSVTQIAFVPNTHYLFTTGKDNVVKYWDADKFEHIQTLKGHHGEVWGLAVSSSGRFVVTSSHDKSMRIWEQTDEPLFLEEEREREQDEMFEAGILDERQFDPDDPTVPPGLATRPSRATMESVKGSERILEALGFMKDPESNIAVATLRGRTPEEYVFHTIASLRTSDVEEALLLLPYSFLPSLLQVCDQVASSSNLKHLETLSRTIFFLLSVHQKQLSLDNALLPLLISIAERVKRSLTAYKRVIGVNRAALGMLQREVETTNEGYQPLFKIAELREAKQRKQRKKARSEK